MADNFERAGIALEIQGFEEYVRQLNKIDDAHFKIGASADIASEKLTNLEKLASTVFKFINNVQVSAESMGVIKLGKELDKAGDAATGFGEDMSEAAKALRKLESISSTIETFDRLTQTLIQNTASLQAGFDNIQNSIKDIDFDKLTKEASNAADSITKLSDAMGKLEKSMGGSKLVDNLGKLIPLLLAAGDIRKLGDVGRGIKSILTSLASIDKIPNFAANQQNFNELIKFMERLSRLKIPSGLGNDLIDIGDALSKITPILAKVGKITIPATIAKGINDLLTVFDKFKGIDIGAMVQLSDAVHKLAIAFRAFTAGAAGAKFSATAIDIARSVDMLLTSLGNFVSQANAATFITEIERLGNAIKIFAQGMAALGRDFANTFANIPQSIKFIQQAIVDLQTTLSNIKDVNTFSLVLSTVAKGFLDLSKAFGSLARTKTIRTDLEDNIKAIVNALLRLSSADIQNAAIKIQAMVGPITQLAEAIKILRKQNISDKMVTRFRDLAGEVGLLERAVRAASATFQAFAKSITRAFASLGKLALHGLANSMVALKNNIIQLTIYLLKLPFTLVAAGFRLISAGLNALFAPVRLLIDLLGKLSNMFTALFSSKSRTVGSGLGLDAASQDVREFQGHIERMQVTLSQTDTATRSGTKGIREFGDAANQASSQVTQLDTRLDSLNKQGGVLSRIFGGNELLRVAGTFKAVDIAADLVTDTLYGMAFGFTNLVGKALTATSEFEQLNLQLTSLQAKEAVKEGLFPDVPTALTDGYEQLQENVDGLINEFRILAIQSPFETKDVSNAFRLAQAFGFTTEQGKELVRTLVDAGSALGFTGNDLTEVTRVFGQIRTTGKLMAQDMNQLAARGIGVKNILQDLVGGTIDWENVTVDANEAITAITRSLQKDFAGAAARSASSIEGLMGSFKSFRDEALRTFAQPIVEALRPLAVGLSDVLFTNEVFDKIENAGRQVASAVESIIINVSAVAGIVKSAFDAIPEPIKNFAIILSQAAGAALAATTAVIALQAAIGLIAAALAFAFVNNPIGQLTALVLIAIKVMNTFSDSTTSVGESFQILGDIISTSLSGAIVQLEDIQQLPDGLESTARWLAEVGNRISSLVNTISLFARIFITAFTFQEDRIGPVISLINQLDASLSGIGLNIAAVGAQLGYFSNIIQEIALILMGIVDPQDIQTIIELFNLLPTSVQNALKNFASTLMSFLNIFINWRSNLIGLFNTIYNAASNMGNNIGEAIQTAAANINSALFNIAVGANNIIQSFFGTANGVTNFLTGLIENIYEFGSGAVNAFAQGMIGAVNLVVDAVQAIADAIAWLLQPGSPPRAMPDIDKWGKAAGQEFVDGMSEADTTSILNIANNIQESLGNIKIPAGASLEQIFETMNWSTDDAGNVVDALGNIILSQDQLAKSANDAASELARVNEELQALEKEQNIQKQQNLVNSLKAALSQPNLSQSNRMVLEQQLKRAELELRRLQLEAEQEGIVPDDGTGTGTGGRGGSGGSKSKTPKVKAPKDIAEPDQKFPKIDKAISKTGKKLKEALDLAVPDTSGIQNAFGDPASGTGLLGRITDSFNNAKKNIEIAVNGIRETILGIFTDIKTRLELVIGEIIRLAGEFGQAFSDAFGTLENQGPIVGGLAALATATYLSGGWGVLTIIASGITALGAAWALASGQVTLDLPENMQAFQDTIDRMRSGFEGAKKQETFIPGIGKIESGSDASLASALMGFDFTQLPESFGALLAAVETEVTAIFTAIDGAISAAFVAYEEGENPVIAFFESLFDIEVILSTIRTEVSGLGELISGIFSGELEEAFGVDGDVEKVAMGVGGDSKIAQFIVGKFQEAADSLAATDFNAMFEEARLNLQSALSSLISFNSTEGLEVQAMGVGGTGESNPIIDNVMSMLKQIADIATTDTDWGQFGTDLKELGTALKEFGESVGTLAGVGVGTVAALSIIGSLETLTKAPSIAESVLQVMDNLVRSLGNLIVAFANLTNEERRTEAFTAFWKNFTGIFTEINEIQADAFDIVGDTVDGIARLVAAISGVPDPETFVQDYDIILAGVTGLLTSLGAFIISVSAAKTAEALATNGPKILEMIKGLSTVNKLIIALTGITAALKKFDESNENFDLSGLTDLLEQLNTLLIVFSALSFVPGGKAAQGGIGKAFQTIWNTISGIFLTIALGPKLGPQLPPNAKGVPKFLNWINKVLWPILSGFVKNSWAGILVGLLRAKAVIAALGTTISGWVSSLGAAVGGVSLGTIAAWTAIITSVIATVAGIVNAYNQNIGNIKTQINTKFFLVWDGIVKIVTGIIDAMGSIGDNEGKIKAGNKAWQGILEFAIGITSLGNYFKAGTTENTQLGIAAAQGFLDIIDRIAGTNLANTFEAFIAPFREFINNGESLTTTLSLMTIRFLDIIGIDSTPLTSTILRFLTFVDAVREFLALNFQRVSIAGQIIAKTFELISQVTINPLKAAELALQVADLVNEFKNVELLEPIDSFAESFQEKLDKINEQEFIIKPRASVELDIDKFEDDSTGFSTPETFGGTGKKGKGAITVPLEIIPQASLNQEQLDTVYAGIQTSSETTLNGISTNINGAITEVNTTLDAQLPVIVGKFSTIATDSTAAFIGEYDLLPSEVEVSNQTLLDKIDTFNDAHKTAGATLGDSFAQGYIDGIVARETDLTNTVTAFTNIALNTIPKVQKSASPSKLTFIHGEDHGEGFIKGVASKIPQAVKVGTAIVNAAVGGMVESVKSSRNQAAINRVLNALLPDIFKDKGLILDFSNWEIIADSETDVAKRATEKATDIAEQFGNSFARVTNQIFDELVGFDPSLAPNFFISEDINKVFTEQVDAILKHRDDTLAQLNAQGKEQFNRNFLAAFIDPEGVKTVAQDFLAQFSDEDLLNLPKVYGAIDAFVGGLRARLEQRAQEGDGWAMSMLGGLDNLNQALRDGVQVAVDEAAKEGQEIAQSGSSVGTAVTSNIASGATSEQALGGLNSAVTTLTTALVSTIQTEFAKITAIVSGQGEASSQGFITGVALLKETLPTTKDEIITLLTGFSEEFTETGNDLGNDFGDGYVAGILEKLQDIYNAAFKAGQEAKRGMQDGQNSASPSKVSMSLGRDFGDGYVIGILSSLDAVRNAGYEMTAAAAQSINDGFNDSAPILTNALQGAVRQGNFWIDESVKFEPPDPEPVEEAAESMNALERATEQAQKIFDSFGSSFNSTFDNIFDKFLELNPDAIADIWDIGPIRDAATGIATELRDTIEAISEELTPEGRNSFGELIQQMFGDEDAISALVETFIGSFDPEELASLPDAAAAIDTFVRQIEDVFLEDDEFEGWLRDAGLTDDVVEGFRGLTSRLREEVQAVLDEMERAEEETVDPARTWIEDMFGPLPDDTEQIGEQLTAGIAQGITSPTSLNALTSAAQIAIDSFLNELRNAGDIHSPSRLTMKLAGEPLVDGIIVGMRNRMPQMLKTARNIGDTVAHSFGTGDWLRQNTLDQRVDMKYNGLVNNLPELFQNVNRRVIGGASKLKDDMLMSGEYNARTGMLTNYSVINNTSHSQDEYHLHMDVDKRDLSNVRRGFRVAKQLGIK